MIANIQITECHKYTKAQMRDALNEMRIGNLPQDESEVLEHRSNFSLINEWCVHSMLYRLGIATERTRDCDLNYPQKWYEKAGYFCAGLIARVFIR